MENEVWKDIEGYEGIYQVSSLGRVRSLDRVYTMKNGRPYSRKGILMQLREEKHGYIEVKLCLQYKKKNHKVHRLVAQAFIENPHNLPFINHKDENKQNNRVENLEWCTPLYNSNYGMCKTKISASHKNHPGLSNPVNQYTMDGSYTDPIDATSGSSEKHPMYTTSFVSKTGEVWTIYEINGNLMTNPVTYNLNRGSGVQVIISESKIVTSYDGTTNSFYETIPNDSALIVKVVKRIDADTLNELTVEAIGAL